MTNVDDKDIEPSTDLGLALSYSDKLSQLRIINDSGAGANAGAKSAMKFVAADPLSELVWSPRKGLSLKCADGSFSGNQFLGVESSNTISGSGLNNNKHTKEENFMTAPAFNATSQVTVKESSTEFPACNTNTGIMHSSGPNHESRTATQDEVDKTRTLMGTHLSQVKEDLTDEEGEDTRYIFSFKMGEKSVAKAKESARLLDGMKLDAPPIHSTSKKHVNEVRDDDDRKQMLGNKVVLASEVNSVKEWEACDDKVQNAEELLPYVQKGIKNEIDVGTSYIQPREKLESTSENDLRGPLSENACVATIRIPSESVHRVRNNYEQDGEMLPRDKNHRTDLYPKKSRFEQYQMKGKAKALSDGNANERILSEDDDSHESVESCNTVGLCRNGKRKWGSEKQLIVGSKRVKRQYGESLGSSSFLKQDSSFVNWISNMVKGLSKSKGEEAPSPSLTPAKSNHGQDSAHQNFIPCKSNREPGCKTMGFQSIFQSLYCFKQKTLETTLETNTLNASYQTDRSKKLDLDNGVCDVDATPIACRAVNGRYLLLNEKFNNCTPSNVSGPLTQPEGTSIDIAVNQEVQRSSSADKKNSCNLTGKERKITSCSSSLGKRKKIGDDDIHSEPVCQGTMTNNFDNPLASLWITRFAPKNSVAMSLSNMDAFNKSIGEPPDCSIDSRQLKPELLNHLGSCNYHKVIGDREQSAEDSLNENLLCLPFQRYKNSDVMASVFARRLDALKHIMTTSEATNDEVLAPITCFFCGVKGHHLRNCPHTSNIELQDLLRNVNSFDGAEVSPCVCVRCFQFNHWAITCPNKSSRVIHEVEYQSSLIDDCPSRNLLADAGGKNIAKTSEAMKSDSSSRACDGNGPIVRKNFDFHRKFDEATPGKMVTKMKLFEKGVASTSRKSKLKEDQSMPLFNFPKDQILDVPKEIFDAVKGLRLSRTDILKWINSHMPLSHLDGLFLRLRLGKWEEGLGGTGYYVACIDGKGMQRKNSPPKSKSSIAVNVGGIKCFVASQYISNHDFLEDELMAWWSATERGGGKIPSVEDLRLKIKGKKALGLS
ncbi:hypothetical protein K2173_006445 [Erythroxylum novogranatense]|uniref:Plus3 domain-containing protein n=1 Tax=Erythroxylum novogranatense TaxID=1862640 RepID=A0AAV8TEC2_9ROSI|nr:hypothetical protein K2173_006445 [Erythroxylum novogranatense]